jgi:hypothetical protein
MSSPPSRPAGRALFPTALHQLLAALFAPLFALLFALYPAPAAAAEAPDFRAPAHWAGGWKELNGFDTGEMRVKPYMPAGASETNWTEAINLTTFTQLPPRTPRETAANVIQFMMKHAQEGCGPMAQATEDPIESEGYITQYAQFYCLRRPEEQVSRMEFLKVVVGKDAVYVFDYMRQAPFFTLKPPEPVRFDDPKQTEAHDLWVKRADDYLRGKVKVCNKGFLGGGPCSK